MILDILVTIKVISALLFAFGIAVAGGVTLRQRSFVKLSQAMALFALASVVLVRGAPHNNALVYLIYENLGTLGLAILSVTVIGGGAVAGGYLYNGGLSERIRTLVGRRGIGVVVGTLGLLAGLSALEQVIRYWDVPGWGDSIFWDRIAHLIARGEMVEGHSYYMPIYQYGTALLYRAFGHYFFVQQIANVMLAPITVVALCLAAREMSLSGWGIILVGVLAASHDYLRYAPHIMQIENWYIPAVAVAIWVALRWRVVPTARGAALIGMVSGLTFSIRAQGAFFHVLLLGAPIVTAVAQQPSRRIFAAMLAGITFVAILAPWTIRNVIVDGRLSVAGTQGPMHMVMSADPRTFYGIRRDLGAAEIMAEWAIRYPDPSAREMAMNSYVFDRFITHPIETLKGAWWRSLAFYGLLPEGVWAPGGPAATNWSTSGKNWLLRNFSTLCLLFAAAIGLALRGDRVAVFIVFGVAASMAPVFVVGFTEARIHYPVLPLLFLAAAGGVAYRPREGVCSLTFSKCVSGFAKIIILLGIVVVFGLAASTGNDRLFRPIIESKIHINKDLRHDGSAPNLTQVFLENKIATGRHAPTDLPAGEVRLRLALSNHHLPVKWSAIPVKGFPEFASDPKTPVYFRASVVTKDGGYDWGTSPVVAIRLHNAEFDAAPREDDIFEIEGHIRIVSAEGLAFIDVDKGWAQGKSFPLPRGLREEMTKK